MKFFYLLLVVFTTAISLPAQPGFNRYYDLGVSGAAIYNGLCSDDTLFLMASVRIAPDAWGVALIRADTNGNILGVHPYFDSVGYNLLYAQFYDIVEAPNGDLVFVAHVSGTRQFFKIHFNRAGEVVRYHTYPHPYDIAMGPEEISVFEDGFLLYGTVTDTNYWYHNFLMKIDGNDQVAWVKRYGEDTLTAYIPRSLRIVDEQTILCGSYMRSLPFADSFWVHSHIKAVNHQGEELWSWTSTGLDGAIYDIYALEDGGYLYVQRKTKPEMNQTAEGWTKIVRADSNLQVIWEFLTHPNPKPYNSAYSLFPTPDGNWVVAETGFPYSGAPSRAIFATKFSPDGQIIWQSQDQVLVPPEYADDPDDYLTANFMLPSGASILTGYTNFGPQGQSRSYGWMIKLDANGCWQTPCTVGMEEPSPLHAPQLSLTITPNPATDQVRVQCPTDIAPGVVEIIDIHGAIVARHSTAGGEASIDLDLSALPAGVYAVRLHAQSGKVYAGKLALHR